MQKRCNIGLAEGGKQGPGRRTLHRPVGEGEGRHRFREVRYSTDEQTGPSLAVGRACTRQGPS